MIFLSYVLKVICMDIIVHVGASLKTDKKVEGASSEADVRAVFINCRQDEENDIEGGNQQRFAREELFKHDGVWECRKKIAVTVMLHEPPTVLSSIEYMFGPELYDAQENDAEAYLPIEHVIDGPNKRRVRLLDPYVLYMKKEKPVQAYRLQAAETVAGILQQNKKHLKKWLSKTTAAADIGPLVAETEDKLVLEMEHLNQVNEDSASQGRSVKDTCHNGNLNISSQYATAKQSEHALLFENRRSKTHVKRSEALSTELGNEDMSSVSEDDLNILNKDDLPFKIPNVAKIKVQHEFRNDISKGQRKSKNKKTNKDQEIEYTVYTIGNPTLWYSVNLQLYQKTSDENGNTQWVDVNGGEPASVSSMQGEWKDHDGNMFVRYRQDLLDRETFTLPEDDLCLLVAKNTAKLDEASESAKYDLLVVPKEDISFVKSSDPSNLPLGKGRARRRAHIQVDRAWIRGHDEPMRVVNRYSQRYLVLPHLVPHNARLELEARADDNQLVYVGDYGRISTIVSESTRKTRSVITVHAANTGLAAANFRIKVRECGPDVSDQESVVAGPELLPPHHTRRFKFELPLEDDGPDMRHCSVALVNDRDEAVAVREATVKKGDRCFCVWHCECSCLKDDPDLSCKKMTKQKAAAAGVKPVAKACEHHKPSPPSPSQVKVKEKWQESFSLYNLLRGILLTLLFFGFMKVLIGMACPSVRRAGLGAVLPLPQRHHPDTEERSVPFEMFVNLCFFIIYPVLMVFRFIMLVINHMCATRNAELPKKSSSLLSESSSNDKMSKMKSESKEILTKIKSQSKEKLSKGKSQITEKLSKIESQSKEKLSKTKSQSKDQISMPAMLGSPDRHERRGALRWKSPVASKLSGHLNLPEDDLSPKSDRNSHITQPLLQRDHFHKMREFRPPISANSSEVDDDYVRAQMHKSRHMVLRSKHYNE